MIPLHSEDQAWHVLMHSLHVSVAPTAVPPKGSPSDGVHSSSREATYASNELTSLVGSHVARTSAEYAGS